MLSQSERGLKLLTNQMQVILGGNKGISYVLMLTAENVLKVISKEREGDGEKFEA